MVAAGKKRPCMQSLEDGRAQKEVGCTRGLSEMARWTVCGFRHLDTVHSFITFMLRSSYSLNNEET